MTMKRVVLPLLICLMLLCGCSKEPPAKTTNPTDETVKVIASGECFTVEEIVKDCITKYSYSITDINGKVIETAFCAEKPRVSQVDKNLVGMRFTDNNHMWTRYFDTASGRVSESFMSAFWSDGTLVAYASYDNGVIMVVRDIFDDEGFRSSTPAESTLWNVHVIAAEVSEDGTGLVVEYVDGDGTNPDAEIRTVTLPLCEIPEEPEE